MSGRVECRECQGGWKRCVACLGRGTKTKSETVNGRVIQRQERCGYCAGDGQVACRKCQGGWVRCPTCQGAGSVIWFQVGSIRHVPVVETIGGRLPSPVRPKDVNASDWQHVLTVPGDGVPTGLPDEISAHLSAELAKRPPNELLRKLEVQILPITEVRFVASPDTGVAQIIHPSRAVRAEGMQSQRRVATAWVTGIVVAIAVVILIALSSDGPAPDTSETVGGAVTGAWVEQELDATLGSATDDPIEEFVCADDYFYEGANIDCTVYYESGDSAPLTVTNTGTDESPSILIDTP